MLDEPLEVACRWEMTALREAKLFQALPLSASTQIVFCGAVTSKLLRFQLTDAGTSKELFLTTIISREEKMAWQSFQDLLRSAVRSAEMGVQGFFGLDILTLDMQNGLRHFNPQDFSCLLMNHAKILHPEAPMGMIRYGQLFALLHKRAPADWGKIDLATYVELMDSEKTSRASFSQRMMRQAGKHPEALYLIHDIGLSPVWKFSAEDEDESGKVEKIAVFHSEKVFK